MLQDTAQAFMSRMAALPNPSKIYIYMMWKPSKQYPRDTTKITVLISSLNSMHLEYAVLFV